MSDVLVICVPTPVYDGRERYASVNAISDHGATHGKKSPEYLDLFRRVREAARTEMERVGWTTAEHPCEVQVVRYHRTRQMADAPNLGKVEADSLAPSTPKQEARDGIKPFAGVYANDRLARPYSADVEYDPTGTDRVVVIVRRRFPDVLFADAPPRKPRVTRLPQQTAQIAVVASNVAIRVDKPVAYKPGDPIPDGYVLLDGQPVKMSREEMLERAFGGSREPAPRARQRSR